MLCSVREHPHIVPITRCQGNTPRSIRPFTLTAAPAEDLDQGSKGAGVDNSDVARQPSTQDPA